MPARNQTAQMPASSPTGRANQAPEPGNRRNSQAVNGAAQRLAASETRYQRAMSSNQCIDPQSWSQADQGNATRRRSGQWSVVSGQWSAEARRRGVDLT